MEEDVVPRSVQLANDPVSFKDETKGSTALSFLNAARVRCGQVLTVLDGFKAELSHRQADEEGSLADFMDGMDSITTLRRQQREANEQSRGLVDAANNMQDNVDGINNLLSACDDSFRAVQERTATVKWNADQAQTHARSLGASLAQLEQLRVQADRSGITDPAVRALLVAMNSTLRDARSALQGLDARMDEVGAASTEVARWSRQSTERIAPLSQRLQRLDKSVSQVGRTAYDLAESASEQTYLVRHIADVHSNHDARRNRARKQLHAGWTAFEAVEDEVQALHTALALEASRLEADVDPF